MMTINKKGEQDMEQTVVSFLGGVKDRFVEFCSVHNPQSAMDEKAWDSPMGPIDVAVSRGTVFEKASCIYCDLTIDTPPVLAEKYGCRDRQMRALVLEIGLHPCNPHVPKGYIELRANIVDRVILAGGTDIFPYFDSPDDASVFGDALLGLCSEHGVDYTSLQKTRADFFTSKYSGQNVGSHAGVYFFHLDQEDFPFFTGLSGTFFDVYGRLVAAHKDDVCTEEDMAHKLSVHGKWIQWVLLEDEGTRFGLDKGIPPDALLGAILPPVATF